MFGSVVAAGLPVLVAVGGLAVGGAGITVLCGVMDVSPYAPMVASMVGLGVGIDYALLLLTRTRDHLAAGLPVVEASERAAVTAGRSVVLAGTTVLVSLLGLRLAGLPTYSAFGFATAITVLAVMVSTLVLVPALCGLLHRRLLPRRVRRGAPGRRPPTGPDAVRALGEPGGRPAAGLGPRRGDRDAAARGSRARHADLAAERQRRPHLDAGPPDLRPADRRVRTRRAHAVPGGRRPLACSPTPRWPTSWPTCGPATTS